MSCEICGNEIARSASCCPFCGSELQPAKAGEKIAFHHRVVNLERGLPVVAVALTRLGIAVAEARQERIQILTLIHGYGSSGKGGVIRDECRKMLDYMQSKGEVQSFICGEQFSSHRGLVRDVLRRFPELNSDRNLNKENKGITLVIL